LRSNTLKKENGGGGGSSSKGLPSIHAHS